MLNLGIIGTNWITHQFVDAAIESGEYRLKGVYSRHERKAFDFAERYPNSEDIIFGTDLDRFLSCSEIDVVYIASPNSLHFSQAKAAIKAGKHVIVEKPIAATHHELKELIHLAEKHHVFIFEGARHMHERNFHKVKELTKNHSKLLGANLNFMKYSSRYDAYLNGENPNIFSAKFSGGALMDLGVYLIYAAVEWFGAPDEVKYFDQKLTSGVDVMGTMIFRYPTFDITMMTGKHADSYLPSEIYLTDGTIRLDAVNSINQITREVRTSTGIESKELAENTDTNPMIDEAKAFSRVINHPDSISSKADYKHWLDVALTVHEIMTTIRKQNGIVFEADK
ncbi:Gfo/Idh/MocA family protein [Vagococcus vulneris]|uniref:Oxidoreductase n=1 Tax=Vagococcus vulneris TaxID=1977869 RepID=A0A429ZZV4_9ENTE|nr:Gfo/Idh/MocA family oxidoreductase [Vagococcus vulneris]RST99547.1 oxidoreductase [Vagococcus vulneris]